MRFRQPGQAHGQQRRQGNGQHDCRPSAADADDQRPAETDRGQLATAHPERPQGTVLVGGNASFSDLQHYLFTGNLHTGSLSFRQGDLHFTDIRAESAFRADPEKITMDGIRLSVNRIGNAPGENRKEA